MASETLSIPGGQETFRIRARRVTKGLQLDVRVHPVLEELIASWCDPTYQRPLHNFGDRWLPATPDDQLLVRTIIGPQGMVWNLDGVGEPLNNAVNDAQGAFRINLGFLRLVGISKGISFVVQGVFSLEEVKRLLTGMKEEIGKLYHQELASFDIELVLSTRER